MMMMHLHSYTLSISPHLLRLRPPLSPARIPSLRFPKPFLPSSSSAASAPIDDFISSTDVELLGKPSPIPIPEDEPRKPPELEEALAPFLKLFRGEGPDLPDETHPETPEFDPADRVGVQYYEPKRGDLVAGVVVSGNENRLDVNVGADALGTMLTKEVLPLYEEELAHALCDLGEEGLGPGRIGVVKDEEALGGKAAAGRPVVEIGTVLFAEVLGRTLSGRPLLSTRRMFRRVAWHRVRQIKQLNEPIEVKIFEWNTGGLLTRIEGLRAFLPKAELMNRVNNFNDLKDNVGRRIYVCISRIDEATNDLIISEREAWDMLYLKEGTLLEGTIRKIFPYGAQVRIGETNRSGLLHISNISRAHITSVSDLLEVDEKVKALVVKSMFPNKISLSIADLESEAGLFLSDKEKVFSEAEEMARRYRKRQPVVSAANKLDPPANSILPFDDEALYANWKWFEFERYEDMKHDSNVAS